MTIVRASAGAGCAACRGQANDGEKSPLKNTRSPRGNTFIAHLSCPEITPKSRLRRTTVDRLCHRRLDPPPSLGSAGDVAMPPVRRHRSGPPPARSQTPLPNCATGSRGRTPPLRPYRRFRHAKCRFHSGFGLAKNNIKLVSKPEVNKPEAKGPLDPRDPNVQIYKGRAIVENVYADDQNFRGCYPIR